MTDSAEMAPAHQPLHPGEHLKDYLEAQELSQSDFAARAGVTEKHVSQILSGKAGISAEMALAIERILGGGAGMWVNLDSRYRLWKVRETHRAREAGQTEWAGEFPLSELRRRGYLQDRRLSPETVAQLLSFFGVASVEEWEAVYRPAGVQFRQSPSFAVSWKAQACYLRICELRAEVWDLAPFNRSQVEEVVHHVRRNMDAEPVELLKHGREELARAGVALVIEPELPKSRLSGAAFWPRRSKAILALTMRFKTADHLLFSFFHEAGHLVRHRQRKTVLETPDTHGDLEREADAFAREVLIPEDAYQKLIEVARPSTERITAAAQEHKLPVDSLIGMLQHDGIIPHGELNAFKRPLRKEEFEG